MGVTCGDLNDESHYEKEHTSNTSDLPNDLGQVIQLVAKPCSLNYDVTLKAMALSDNINGRRTRDVPIMIRPDGDGQLWTNPFDHLTLLTY